MNINERCIFVVGSKSVGNYGGFETFVDKLTEYFSNDEYLKFYVACKKNGEGAKDPTTIENATIISKDEFYYHNATCFQIKIPEFLGAAQAIYYDIKSLDKAINIIIKNNITNPIVYILACRIGPFFKKYVKRIHAFGGKVYVNPDGHEWMRAKWNYIIKKYWKKSEELMVKYADLVVCDSINIEKYIHNEYDGRCDSVTKNPTTTYIAYGVDVLNSKIEDNDINWKEFLLKFDLKPKEYYMTCGRFVPENNYYTMINEFLKSKTKKDFILITTLNKKYQDKLDKKLNFRSDKRIKFIGPIYDYELLKKIRENAYANLHGHSVGGTNPSLLEGLAATNINLLYDCEFNREVADEGALYWSLDIGNLSKLINETEKITKDEILRLGRLAKKRIVNEYTWDKICGKYETIFKSFSLSS